MDRNKKRENLKTLFLFLLNVVFDSLGKLFYGISSIYDFSVYF